MIIEFDVDQFRIDFPAFADPTLYPDAVLENYFSMASCYISTCDYGWLHGACRALALNLLTAHLALLNTNITAGQTPGMIQGATIDKITVTRTPPPLPNQFQFWLGLTGYGQQLLALLQTFSIGGFMVGALPELSSFRKVGGIF